MDEHSAWRQKTAIITTISNINIKWHLLVNFSQLIFEKKSPISHLSFKILQFFLQPILSKTQPTVNKNHENFSKTTTCIIWELNKLCPKLKHELKKTFTFFSHCSFSPLCWNVVVTVKLIIHWWTPYNSWIYLVIISGPIWGSFRGRDHFGACAVHHRKPKQRGAVRVHIMVI